MDLCMFECIYKSVGRDGIPVRRPDSQSRDPGFKSHCGKFDHPTLLQLYK